MRKTLPSLVLIAALVGCTQFPDLDNAVTPRAQNADYPALAPIDSLLPAPASNDPVTAQSVEQDVAARVAALRRRARRLQNHEF